MIPAPTGPVLAGAALIALAAPGKLRMPAPTVRALQSAGLPASAAAVRGLAFAELGLGSWVAFAPSRWSVTGLAVAYLGFAVFVVVASRRGGSLSSCGCFGRDDTPPTRLHLVITLGLAAAGLMGVVHGTMSVQSVLSEGVLGLTLVVAVTLLTSLLWVCMALHPRVSTAAKLSSRPT